MISYTVDNFPIITIECGTKNIKLDFNDRFKTIVYNRNVKNIFMHCENLQTFDRCLEVEDITGNKVIVRINAESTVMKNLKYSELHFDPFLILTIDDVPTKVSFKEAKTHLYIKCGKNEMVPIDLSKEGIQTIKFDDNDDITLNCINEGCVPSCIRVNDLHQIIGPTETKSINLKNIIDKYETVTPIMITLDGVLTKYNFNRKETGCFPIFYVLDVNANRKTSMYPISKTEELYLNFADGNEIILWCDNRGETTLSRTLRIDKESYHIDKDSSYKITFARLISCNQIHVYMERVIDIFLNLHKVN